MGWKPDLEESYWYVRAKHDALSFIVMQKEWGNSDYDYLRLAKGNVYPNCHEAQAVADKLTDRLIALRRRDRI